MSEENKDMIIETEEIKEVEKTAEQISNQGEEIPVVEELVESLNENPVSSSEGESQEETPEGDKFNLQEFLEIPEVKDFVQKVRKQEKDKLYGEIDKKDKKIKELEGEASLLDAKIKTSEKTSTNVQSTLEDKVQKLTQTVEGLQSDLKKKDLDLFKEKALKEAGDDLVIDLVGGETEEEISASIETAKLRYQEIVERAKGQKPKVNVPKPTNPQQPPSVKQLTQEEIAQMSPKEWAEHREMVKKQLGLRK